MGPGRRPLRVNPPWQAEPFHPDFLRYANGERLKWVVTPDGELLVVPHTWPATDSIPSLAGAAPPLLAAGEAEIAVHGATRFGIRITPHSGHYLNGAAKTVNGKVVEIGRQAFARFGITFPP